ncbi:MAG: hypothetical protein IPP83_13690 [Flavobacteriales bacterium]|nr:hypothetical protein [Flavobacteriales bacterium]MBL0128472.1 hypothetical protein [Flavobacteriales bacterium]MCC6937298.1 hypothetical protein [Flavobacteriales bacterium]
MRSRLLLLLLLLPFSMSAQLLDSIGLFLQEPPRLVVRLDVRGSFISNSNVRFLGAKVGLQHARRFQYGVGYSFLITPVEQEVMVDGVTTTARLRLGYVSPYVDYAFYQRGPWEVRLPVQIGIGSGSVVYDDAEGRTKHYARSMVFFYEPAMTVQYRFLKYFGIGAGWGFRLAIHSSNDLGEDLTAPIYILGLRIFPGEMIRDAESR